MKSERKKTMLTLIAGAILFPVGSPAYAASGRAAYEGELRFNAPNPLSEPPPLVRVITQNDRVQQITLRDRHQHPGRLEVFTFTGTTLTRYRISSAISGQPDATYDLATDTTLNQQERERVTSIAELLLRHFHNKGGYRKLPSPHVTQ
ncbi:MAG: hypothetical protein KDK97_23820 [Verrucomicrobiales bacterium]|nr:hypothetical protein [Verrucomicrobiales bacterium]MCP5556927.1 hypothetical protein [Verrucomicrobiaceae bacterium]